MFKILIGVVIAAFVVIIGFLIIDPDLNQTATTPITEVSDSANDPISGFLWFILFFHE